MKVGVLREALEGLPEDMDVTIATGLAVWWPLMKSRFEEEKSRARFAVISRGEDPSAVDGIEGPYRTLNRTGDCNDVIPISLSSPDFENNRIALEL